MNTQSARSARDAGIGQALDHAQAVYEGWADEAANALRMYIAAHPGQQFMAEDVRNYAYDVLAVPYPPHCRAWGGIIAAAAREGLIVRVGIGPVKTASSHMANATIWSAAPRPIEPTFKGGALARLAGQLCQNPDFLRWGRFLSSEQAAEAIRQACGIESRALLDHRPEAARTFHSRFRRPFAERSQC